MSEVINKAIKEVKKLSSVKERNLSDDYVFGIVCYKFFFNNGRFDNQEFHSSFTDKARDGGVDLVAVDENPNGSRSLTLIQSKSSNKGMSKDEVLDAFNKMAKTVSDFEAKKTARFNDELRRIYLEKRDEAENDIDNTIKLVLFQNINKDEESNNKIINYLREVKDLDRFNCDIYYHDQVVNQIESFDNKPRFVDYGKLEIWKEDGKIENGETGLLVNAKALSLKDFFNRYKDKGLFEQNYRYFISQKKIDSQIINSLHKKRDQFWYLNNGIIIACKDFHFDGDNIKLTDFSIVNGCQTTTLLGQHGGSNEDIDFRIACKIVKPLNGINSTEAEFQSFISSIAEASNSQKPISDRDLKSNDRVQQNLQKLLKNNEPKVYMEIKRGEAPAKGRRGLHGWQRTKNDDVGQLILSFILQSPGTARSNKRKIFADTNTYQSIFHRNHNKETLVDILELLDLYNSWLNLDRLNSNDERTIARNGKLCILSILGFLIKHKKRCFNHKTDTWLHDSKSDNLDGILIKQDRESDEPIYEIFYELVYHLADVYERKKENFTSISNFFKLDSTYNDVILPSILSQYFSSVRKGERLFDPLEEIIHKE